MVVALPSGRVVFARNADLSLEPASNEKLGVTYAALVELGAVATASRPRCSARAAAPATPGRGGSSSRASATRR